MKLSNAALLLLSLATTAHSWSSIDTATLQFWSPPSLCTLANVEIHGDSAVCSEPEPNPFWANVKLDNTGAICYSNPMSYSSNGSSWFTWLAPDPNPNTTTWADLWAYSLFVPNGEPVPQCDKRGVCDPCDALNPIRGSDPADWNKPNTTLIEEMGYSLSSEPSIRGSGCGVTMFVPANDVHPTNFCAPFQGNITVETGDPYTCVNQGITTAAKCGGACETENLKKSVFAKTENGEVACCTCTYYDRQGTTAVCEGANSGLCSADDSPLAATKLVLLEPCYLLLLLPCLSL